MVTKEALEKTQLHKICFNYHIRNIEVKIIYWIDDQTITLEPMNKRIGTEAISLALKDVRRNITLLGLVIDN